MRASTSVILVAASSSITSAFAIPVEPETKALQSRADGSRSDPIWINVDCTGTARVCNVDCEAILCHAAPNPEQRDKGNQDEKRKESGYSPRLYRNQEPTRLEYGIQVTDHALDITGRSAEESVMALAAQSGNGELIYPVDPAENSLVGSRVNGGLQKNKVNAHGGWYFRWFTNYGPVTETDYCYALQEGRKNNHETYSTGSHPDYSVCREPGKKKETDPGRTGMVRTDYDVNGHAHFHMLGEGDIWTGQRWGAGGSGGLNKRAIEDLKVSEQYYKGSNSKKRETEAGDKVEVVV